MSTLLIGHAECAAHFDDARRELRGASVLVSDQLIEAIGPAAELPATGSDPSAEAGGRARADERRGHPGRRPEHRAAAPPNSDTPVGMPFSSV